MAKENSTASDNDMIITTGVKNADKTKKDLDDISKSIINVVKTARMALNQLRGGFKFTKGLDTKQIEKELKSVQKASKIKIQKESIDLSQKNVALSEKTKDKNYINALAQQKVLKNTLKEQVNASAKLKTAFKDIAINIGNAVLKLFSFQTALKAIKKITNIIKQANETYGNYMETLNLAEVSFQENAEAVVSWSKDYADSLGLSYNEVLKFSSSLKSLADSMGIANDVGTKMSTTLTTLIYNIASLRNLDFEDAYSKIESTIFSGQLRTARTIGVDISVASMQALVEELGYAEIEYKNLTEAQKVQLRTIKVLRDLGSQSAGDLEKTLTSTSNRLRILESSWQNLLTVIGNATNTVFSDLLAYVIGIVQGLSRFIQDMQPLTQSTGLENTANAMGTVEEEIEGVNEQLGLLQIDKFETLSGAGDKKNEISFDADVDTALNDYNALNDTMQKIDDKVKEVSDSFYAMFQNIDKEAFQDFASALGDFAVNTLPTLITAIIKVVTWLINFISYGVQTKTLIPILITLAGAVFTVVSAIKGNIAGMITGLVIAGIGGVWWAGQSIANAVNGVDTSSASDIASGIGGNTSKANGSASSALQSTQGNSNQTIKVGLDINGREFASAVYNDLNYTNQRYTGASLGGN